WWSRCESGVRVNAAFSSGIGDSFVAGSVGFSTASGALSDYDRLALGGLTNEQWSHFVSLVNSAKQNNSLSDTHRLFDWMYDSGATHHMTGFLEFLSDVQDIPARSVQLPNGSLTMVTKAGTVYLEYHITLYDVLHVPSLR
ncbi:Unknown protein, partial [Striga hermonthica]